MEYVLTNKDATELMKAAAMAGISTDAAAKSVVETTTALADGDHERDRKGKFMWACTAIRRKGAKELFDWLEVETDFFSAPASTKHHGAHPGGLVEHSLNVYRRLRELTIRDMSESAAPGSYRLENFEEETVAILGLLHDICKVNCYKSETLRRRDPETSRWEDYQGYVFQDDFPLGHGEKSLYLIARYMDLTPNEAMAIRWHMGAYDNAVRGGARDMNAAMKITPWVWRLQEADMCATWIDEKITATTE